MTSVSDTPDPRALAQVERERERSKRRRDRVLMISIVELLTILVFVAMTYALVNETDASLRPNLERELREARARIEVLETENGKLQAERDMWRRIALAARDLVGLPQNATPEEIEREIRRRLGGSARGICASPSGTLIRVHLLADGKLDVEAGGGLRGAPWTPEETAEAHAIPGFEALIAEPAMTQARFLELAAPLNEQGVHRAPPCGYRAETLSEHDGRRLAFEQVNTVRSRFIVPTLQ